MTSFATPSAKHDSEPAAKKYCTNCKREVRVSLRETICPNCHENSLLKPAAEQRKSRRGV